MPAITESPTQIATGLRCFIAIGSSIVAFLLVVVFGGLTFTHDAVLAWKILEPLTLAIASAILIVIVPGVNTFSKTTLKMMSMALFAIVALHLFSWHLEPDRRWIDGIKTCTAASQVISLVLMGMISPIFEEVYFRGLLFPIVSIHLGAKMGAVLTAILFILLHPGVNVFVATAIYTVLVYRSRSVYPGIAAHVTFNSILLVRVLLW